VHLLVFTHRRKGNSKVTVPKGELKFLSRAYEEINSCSTFTEISCKYVIHVTLYQQRCVILEVEWGEVMVTWTLHRQLLMCGELVTAKPCDTA
jgi:hypothetical protein